MEFLLKYPEANEDQELKKTDKDWKKKAVDVAFGQIITGLAKPTIGVPSIPIAHYKKA